MLVTVMIFLSSASLENARQLHTDLLANYSKYVRPVKNQKDPVYVYVSLAVIAIQEFDEVLERFSVAGALFLVWNDQNMVWDDKDYDGVDTVFTGYKQVWVPELILTNPSEKLESFGKEWQLIRYDSNGWASWTPGDLIKATCSIDVRYFPFDTQECSLVMYTWGYLTNEVKLIAGSETVETSLLGEHVSWHVVNTTAKTDDVAHVSKITFTFVLKRKPQYVIVNVILPILFLCLLNVLVFALPAESGERVSYAITVLLSIAVFMTIVSDTLPKTSEPLPIISYFMMIDLINSAIISLFTVLNLRIYHKKEDAPIPNWLIRFYNLLCCSCRRSESVEPYTEDGMGSTLGFPISKVKSKRNAFIEHSNDIKSEHSNGIKAMKLKANTDDALNGANLKNGISWQDISVMIDYILLIVFILLTLVSFITFLIMTHAQTD